MNKKLSLPFIGFLQATGFMLYVVTLSFVLRYVFTIFDKVGEEFFAPLIMLMIFVMSAVISAMLILGKAAVLFWDKNYKESFKLVGWTVASIFMWLLIIYSVITFSA